MIQRVRHFQESGIYQRIGDVGRDDLGTLANALDAGLSSIAQRQREREEFLEIVAHELKTPVTSIQGYASLLVGQPDAAAFKTSALESIYRQSWRLSRLMDGLFLAMRARSQKLRFSPSPIDMSELVQHVIDEMKPFVTDKTFSPRIQSRVAILADEALLGHALWSLFTCAAALSADRKPVHISLAKVDHRARLTVDIEKTSVPLPAVHELFMPFREIQFETGTSIRSSIGLYLTREIVRIHNGDLHVQEVSDTQPEFVMELPL